MKCLQIHNDYIIPGGETKSVKLIAKTLTEHGIEVIQYYKDNKEINNSGFVKKCSFGYKSIYNKDTVKEITEILKTQNIDFALVHNISPLISNSVYEVLINNNIPIYKYIQNYNLVCLNGSLGKGKLCERCNKRNYIGFKNKCYKESYLYTLMKLISKRAFDKKYKDKITGYIAISNYIKNRHVELGLSSSKIHVLYHFVEKVKVENTIKNKEKYYIYMGRLAKEKGIQTLIKAFKCLDNAELLIMGDGDEREYLEDYVRKNNMNNIKFLGFKDGDEKKKILENAYASIVPSEWDEPFGRSVIESFQVGVPVIASDRGGLSELVINNKNGFKFECGNILDLVEKIRGIDELSEEQYIKLKENCLKDIDERFSKKTYIGNIKQLIGD